MPLISCLPIPSLAGRGELARAGGDGQLPAEPHGWREAESAKVLHQIP